MSALLKLYDHKTGELLDTAVEKTPFEIIGPGSLFPGPSRAPQWIAVKPFELDVDGDGVYLRITVRELR